MPRIILTTGGTGGHIFPALAVAEVLKARGVDLLFVGGTYGPEAGLAMKAGIDFLGLPGRGFLGRGLRAFSAAGSLLLALGQALKAVRNFRPCAVAAFGGYASFAAGIAAVAMRVPLLIHEQNAIAGASNRFLSRFAQTICSSAQDTHGFKRPFVVTGNPVRSNLERAPGTIPSASRNLLVLGGSQGARSLNDFLIGILPMLKRAGINIRHQAGQKDYERVVSAYAEAGMDPSSVSPFIEDMASAYRWANLALCRAGASTISELCICGLPSVLVPFPAAIHDHQAHNARILANAGAAELLPEPDLESHGWQLIKHLLANPEKLTAMSRAASTLGRPDAAYAVASEIEKLCKG